MIGKFLKTYLETNATILTCPYSPLLASVNPTKIFLDGTSTDSANNVISIHETSSSNLRPTFWNGTTNPPEIINSTILIFIRSKMASDSGVTPLADGDYVNVRQSAEAIRDLINRIPQTSYTDSNGSYVIDQIRPVSTAAFDSKDAQGRNMYLLRFEAIWKWNATT